MRLLVISREYEPMIAGVSKYASEIMKRVKSGKTVIALEFPGRKNADVIEISSPASIRKRSLKAAYFVVKSVFESRGRDFNVVVGNAFVGSVAGTAVKLLCGKPLVSIIYDVDFLGCDVAEYGRVNKFLRKHAIGAILRLSDRIIVDSEKVKKDIMRFYGTSGKKIVTIPCGISLKTRFREIGGPKKKVILFVGNMAEKKGLTVLVKSMKTVVENYPGVELWLVGPDAGLFEPYKKRLAHLVAMLEIKDHVKFLSMVDLVEPYYKACDFLVLPSLHSEGFGLPIIEAAYFGKPAIATEIFKDTGVIKEKTGLIIPANDSKKLAVAMLKFLENNALKKRLGLNAKKFVRKFDWDASAREFERVVKNLSQ